MIKAVFFDVDGTLLSHKTKSVPESARRAIRKLQEKGIQCIVATGRHKKILDMLPVKGIDFDFYILLTGQLCMDRDGGAVAGHPLSGIGKERVVRMFREKTIPLMFLEKDTMYANFVDAAVEKAHRAVSTPVPQVGEYTGGDVYQAIAYVDSEARLEQLAACCKLTRWSDYAVDIISTEGGKVAGIQAYLEKAGISREETMAFGDGENDIEMLEYVQVGIAMGNAEDTVKAIADYVTASVEDDGIEKALIHLGLLE